MDDRGLNEGDTCCILHILCYSYFLLKKNRQTTCLASSALSNKSDRPVILFSIGSLASLTLINSGRSVSEILSERQQSTWLAHP